MPRCILACHTFLDRGSSGSWTALKSPRRRSSRTGRDIDGRLAEKKTRIIIIAGCDAEHPSGVDWIGLDSREHCRSQQEKRPSRFGIPLRFRFQLLSSNGPDRSAHPGSSTSTFTPGSPSRAMSPSRGTLPSAPPTCTIPRSTCATIARICSCLRSTLKSRTLCLSSCSISSTLYSSSCDSRGSRRRSRRV